MWLEALGLSFGFRAQFAAVALGVVQKLKSKMRI